MKRVLAFLLVLVMLFALTACGGKSEKYDVRLFNGKIEIDGALQNAAAAYKAATGKVVKVAPPPIDPCLSGVWPEHCFSTWPRWQKRQPRARRSAHEGDGIQACCLPQSRHVPAPSGGTSASACSRHFWANLRDHACKRQRHPMNQKPTHSHMAP